MEWKSLREDSLGWWWDEELPTRRNSPSTSLHPSHTDLTSPIWRRKQIQFALSATQRRFDKRQRTKAHRRRHHMNKDRLRIISLFICKFKHEPFHTYPYIPLALWCATSSKLAPQTSNTTATSALVPPEVLNTYHPQKAVGKEHTKSRAENDKS